MNTPRWYMLNKMGMATLCASKKDAEKEAAEAQIAWPHMGPHRAVQLVEAADVDRAMRAAQPVVAQQQAGAWTSLPGTLPKPGKPVLLDIGKKYPIRAMWVAKHTLEAGMEDDSGFGEYDETSDTYYCPEGWYEWNEQEECHWRVDKALVAWCELPTKTGTAQEGKK